MTKCLTYEESFVILKKATEINIALMDAVVKKLDAFHGNINHMLDSLSKKKLEIPVKRDRKPLFDRKFQFKKDKDLIKMKDIEPNLSKAWNILCNQIICQQASLRALNDALKKPLINQFLNLSRIYSTKTGTMEKYSAIASKDLESTRTLYHQSYNAYQQLSENINDIKQRMDSDAAAGKPRDQILKYQQSLNDLKSTFNKLQDEAVNALEKYNYAKLSYTKSLESALTVFEEAEIQREEGIRKLFTDFTTPITNYTETKQQIFTNLRETVEKISVEEDIDKYYKPSDVEVVPSTVIFEAKKLPFVISEYVPPEQIYSDKLHQYVAEVKTECTRDFECDLEIAVGEQVTVMSENGEFCKVITEKESKIGTVRKQNLSRLSEFDHKLYRVVADYNPPGRSPGMAVVAGEVVMSLLQSQNEILCQNPYNKKGTIPLSNLKLYQYD
ncbi:hypothetical protein GPJ56_002873 [Histomonas meleagridis]|uniref:uncharacterized protein n=1 Tax=Histomonas meleagridis TaxID=135588 RepID=UPI003559C775|nr:hypothetical protein GPJ56_002873 [Histomonas meleagridis]KAH0800426.1 hypothetical protein GO595_006837 [Histomonas meleagridis]